MILHHQRLKPLLRALPRHIDVSAHSRHERNLWSLQKGIHAGLNGLRKEAIVGIEKDEKIAARFLQAEVSSRGHTAVGLAQATNTRLASGDGVGVVAGTIVDYDNLDVRISLG